MGAAEEKKHDQSLKHSSYDHFIFAQRLIQNASFKFWFRRLRVWRFDTQIKHINNTCGWLVKEAGDLIQAMQRFINLSF